ncbi:MAG TPA: hypothetical protein VJV04_13865 [Nitrospiraceae bacterium]|nr:hypothetical protein [Nitrospiraceae bacterium]
MYKIKKKPVKTEKPPVLYNVIEDYTESDPPGNVTVCAMTEPEDLSAHARVLSESYEIPLDVMTQLLTDGGIYIYPQTGLLVTQGVFTSKIDPAGLEPKQTWVLDVMQYAEAEQLVRSYGISLEEASARVFYRTLATELQDKLRQHTLGESAHTPGGGKRALGAIHYIDFRKDWSPHFKRLCIMPDGRLIETGGLADFAGVHGITVTQARRLIEEGGTLEVDSGEILACQIVNGQPSVARFSRAHYAKAKNLVATRQLHLMDALSEVALQDPLMMRALKRLEQTGR